MHQVAPMRVGEGAGDLGGEGTHADRRPRAPGSSGRPLASSSTRVTTAVAVDTGVERRDDVARDSGRRARGLRRTKCALSCGGAAARDMNDDVALERFVDGVPGPVAALGHEAVTIGDTPTGDDGRVAGHVLTL